MKNTGGPLLLNGILVAIEGIHLRTGESTAFGSKSCGRYASGCTARTLVTERERND